MTTKHIGIDLESTNAIKEDWGGKPFVDMIRRWKYALEKYPEVCGDISIGLLSSLIYGFRLILIELWLRARVGEGMLSSQSLPLSLSLSHTHTLYSVHWFAWRSLGFKEILNSDLDVKLSFAMTVSLMRLTMVSRRTSFSLYVAVGVISHPLCCYSYLVVFFIE